MTNSFTRLSDFLSRTMRMSHICPSNVLMETCSRRDFLTCSFPGKSHPELLEFSALPGPVGA